MKRILLSFFALFLFAGCQTPQDKLDKAIAISDLMDQEMELTLGQANAESEEESLAFQREIDKLNGIGNRNTLEEIQAAMKSVNTPVAVPAKTPEISSTPTSKTSEKTLTSLTMNKNLQKDLPKDDDDIAVIHSTNGDIYIRFFPEEAPKTVENFVGLAKKGYYDGIIFHRIIDGFMLQGGDPTGTGMGGESLWGGKFKDEFSQKVSNAPYSLSMANAGPGTNGSQFFINQANNDFLDGRHSVFGEVLLGTNTVEDIMKVKTGAQDRPVNDVVMNSVEIVKYSTIKDKISK